MTNEILTPQQMYQADARAIAGGIASLKLMENAGKAVAAEIAAHFSKAPVAILCGPGNNGGDGFVVARLLAARKWPVRVYLVGKRADLKGDAEVMAKKWKGGIGTVDAFQRSLAGSSGPKVIVDAIYGAGLNRDFPMELAATINRSGRPVVAVDVPSGLDGLTGQPRGHSVKADVTVTFFRKKPAHVLQPGRSLCGEIVVADIGIPAAVAAVVGADTFENTAPTLPAIQIDAHKYKRGSALIWSGPELATGASRLAAQAAARTGAGLTTLIGPRDALRVHAAHVTSIMLKPVESVEDLRVTLEDKRVTACCIGPAAGVSEQLRKAVLRMLAAGPSVVLDADALTAFAEEPEILFAAIRNRHQRACVLTPHEGEFARLFGSDATAFPNRIERARAAARLSGATIVLKGPDSVIATPLGRAFVNTNAPAKLATAGSGDVLAGIITGLLAQGMDGEQAACAGVWLHADAANRSSRQTIVAEDLLEQLGY